MTHPRTLSFAATLAAPLLIATLASSACAQVSDNQSAVDREVQDLKVAYLQCDQAATERLLGFGDAASCSIIYERLLKVGFGGDFKRLLAWWQIERAKARGERVATP